MGSNKFSVVVQTQGQNPKPITVSPSATIRTALLAAGFSEDSLSSLGSLRINSAEAELSQRLKKDDYITVTPKVAGGR